MPQFSIIVPVYNQPELLRQCLSSIRGANFEDYELIVSDDGSEDASAIADVTAEFGAKVVRSGTRKGSAAARNRAVRESNGQRLAFFDADVTLHPDTLGRIARAFEETPTLAAVMGSYDKCPSAGNMVSQFRNLLHAHVHHRSQREASTFWTGCGAIDRHWFEQLGGFNEGYDGPSIEDVELGLRLHRAGGRIILDSSIQVTHHKKWTLSSMVQTDLFRRSIPWTGLLRDHTLPCDLNFRRRDRAAAVLSGLALVMALVAFRHGAAWGGMIAGILCSVALLQSSSLAFLAECRGAGFAALCFPLLLLYNLVCLAGLFAGLVKVEQERDRWFIAGVAACACLIASLQLLGGAYRAEFNGDPDEAAHFVSGLMVYDYVTALPSGSPVKWAQQYYLHYPKVAIGHWPPGLYILEAVWWLFLPPSRWSVLLLEGALVLLAAVVFCRLAHTLAPSWVAWIVTALLIVSPVTQQSYEMAMADALCLLFGVLVADATVRLLNRPSGSKLALTAFWVVCALLAKGTGAVLLPVPVLALLVTGKWRLFPRKWLWNFVGAVIAGGLGWYAIEKAVFHHSLILWGGMTMRMPWPVTLVAKLAGVGIAVLAGAGFAVACWRRQPTALVAAMMLLSAVSISYVLRAMNQSRHWIIILPVVLLLATELLVWLGRWKAVTAVAAVAGLAMFPWQIFSQAQGDFSAFVAPIQRPARILVSSSNSASEGALVAAIALSDQRPASIVARATKMLATSGWNGEDYRLTATSPSDVEQRLDEFGINTVVLNSSETNGGPPHHRLLEQTVRNNHLWRECMASTGLTGWCRTAPNVAVRKPLRIDVSGQLGITIEEIPVLR